jgi:transposase-like protein
MRAVAEHRAARRRPHRLDGCKRWAGRADVLKVAEVCDRVAKLRTGSFFPILLERRRRVDHALLAVVMEAYLHGVSPARVDDLVKPWGPTRASPSPRCRGSASTSTLAAFDTSDDGRSAAP